MTAIALALCVSIAQTGCGSKSPAVDDANSKTAESGMALMAEPDGTGRELISLALPSAWMPEDWDTGFYVGAGAPLSPQNALAARQNLLNTAPFILWTIANDDRLTEAFEPIWVWYTAMRSCERGIALSEDLAGEFGNRERGEVALTKARNELKAWAATEPKAMTLYFPAKLGQWDAQVQAFSLQELGQATAVRPKAAVKPGSYADGATVQLWTDGSAQAISHFQAATAVPECVSADGSKVYKFDRRSQWWVVFGDAERGMGGLVNYKSRAMLPPITMSREAAAAFAQRNPDRAVEVAVTFVPAGSTFVQYTDQSAIRAKLVMVVVSDAQDDEVLASQQY